MSAIKSVPNPLPTHGRTEGGIQGWHVLAGMLAFFGVIFAVNGFFLFSALKTHTGIVSKQPYRKGLDYNDRIVAEARQQQLGWSQTLELNTADGTVDLKLADRHDMAISGLSIIGYIGRPSTEQHDVALILSEASAPGTYRAKTGHLQAGNWLIQLEAQQQTAEGPETVYRMRKRLWLKP